MQTADNASRRKKVAKGIARNLQREMSKRGVNQQEVASMCKLSPMVISRALRPEQVPPSVVKVLLIARALDMSVEELCGEGRRGI